MLFNEVGVAVLQNSANKPILSNYIYGLGGRDMTQDILDGIYQELDNNAKAGKLTHATQQFVGLRGTKMAFN